MANPTVLVHCGITRHVRQLGPLVLAIAANQANAASEISERNAEDECL